MENTLVMENTRKEARIVFIDYLRSFVTLLVLAHHSCLAYTTFAKFNASHYLASSAPIVDTVRWGFLDYAENFNDVYFMSLMFAISGLFVWPLLKKRVVLTFLKDRILRLGVPFVVGVIFLMPLAYYPSWRLAEGNADISPIGFNLSPKTDGRAVPYGLSGFYSCSISWRYCCFSLSAGKSRL